MFPWASGTFGTMRAVALRDELIEIRKSLQDGEPATEGELPDSRLAEAFKRISNESGILALVKRNAGKAAKCSLA